MASSISAASFGTRFVVAAVFGSLILCNAQAPGVAHGGGSCATADDCSLGGVCTNSHCVCDPWFTGPSCTLLNLQRPRFNDQAGTCGRNFDSYYSWGGRAVTGASDGLFHLYASFMCRTTVSSSAHFVSDVVDGAYQWAAADCDAATNVCTPIVIPWSHNTVVANNAPGADPALLLFHIGDGIVDPAQWAPCYNKSQTGDYASMYAPAADEVPPPPPRRRANPGNTAYVAVAPQPNGPWTRALNNSGVDIDFTGSWTSALAGNPAPLVFPNGSVYLYFTAVPCPPNSGALAANCIAVATADTWAGPYSMNAAQKPITYPESEDPFVFQDFRGNFHLLTNVNTCHARCAQGVPCGGHAWSHDGIHFTNLTVGAFGPVVTFKNGTEWHNAYVERPLVTMAADGTTPLAFHVGMGRSAYEDSCNWVQLFCTNASDPQCGPTIPAPVPPPPVVRLRNGGQCLVIFNHSAFPCTGANAAGTCPVIMGDCASDASALWMISPEGHILSAAVGTSAVGLNVDCFGTAPRTIVKALESSFSVVTVANGRLEVAGGSACLNSGQGTPLPPCGPTGEIVLPHQIQLSACTDPAAQGWSVLPSA